MPDLGDYVQGSDGQWYSPDDTPPLGVTLNSRPNFGFDFPQGGQLTTTTPNSSTGAPRPPSAPYRLGDYGLSPNSSTGVPALSQPRGSPLTDVSNTGPGIAGALARGGLYGVGGYLMGKTIEPQPLNAGEQDIINRHLPAPGSTPGMEGDPRLAPPVPPGPPPPPVGMSGPHPAPGPMRPTPQLAIPPFNISPPAAASPTSPSVPYPPPRPKTGGGGGRSRAPPMMNLQPTAQVPPPMPVGHYQATMGNARGNPTWVPGDYGSPANPSPQLYRGATTTYGVSPNAGAPIGAQNYYARGSAPMGPGDWTGTVPPGSSPVQSGNARGGGGVVGAAPRAPVRGPLAKNALSPFGSNPGPIDPEQIALANRAGPGPIDPSIIAQMKMRNLLYAGQNPGDVGGYGAGT